MRIINGISNFIFVEDKPQKADIIFIPGGSYAEISELLVKEFGFVLYKCDDHLVRYIEEGAAAGIDIMKKYKVKGYLSNCSDPKKAFKNWMERDAKFAQIIIKNTNDYKMNVITVDGSKSIDENYLKVRQIFGLV